MSAQYIQILSLLLRRHSDVSILQKCEPRNPEKNISQINLNWIPAYAPQGYSDLLSAKALAKSYAGMTM